MHPDAPLETPDGTAPSYVSALRSACQPAWSQAVHHRFVTELFAGTLPDETLARYLVQDYTFCDGFVALLGQGTASAPTLESRLPFARQLGAFAADEDSYFTETFDALGVGADDRRAPQRLPVTERFIALMSEAAHSRSYPRVLAVLVVAELLYRDWASRELPLPTARRHRRWVELHNNPEFNAWVDWLVAELDRNEPMEESERIAVSGLFSQATALELAFFEDCYRG